MSEFVSKLEEIMPAIELNFEPTPSFGEYKQYLEHAVSHPAKANTKLLEFLVLNFTEEGDVVLDPMAGSGSTGVVAALHGRNAIQIDIEPKFYEFMEKARENVEKASTLAPKGWIKNILGDARHLSKLLEQVDVCITSPPYEEGLSHRRHHTPNTGRTEKLWSEKHLGSYPDSRDNIGTLKSSDDEYRTLSEGRIQELIKKLMKNGKPSYLSEMLKVYHEMYKVLKPNGRAIIIIKPFIRNKKVVDLPYYTYLLMSYCGFVLEKLYKLRLKNKSFWRLLYSKKYPNIPSINHEYVLVYRKA
jgi:DNA modification methylase